jgi:hypothetical protein
MQQKKSRLLKDLEGAPEFFRYFNENDSQNLLDFLIANA